MNKNKKKNIKSQRLSVISKNIKVSSFCDLFPLDIVKTIFSMLNSKCIKTIRLVDKKDNKIVTRFAWFSIFNIYEKDINVLRRFISCPFKPKIRSLVIFINNENIPTVKKVLAFSQLFVLKLTLDFDELSSHNENNYVCTIFDIKIQVKNLILKDYHIDNESVIILPNCVQGLYLSDIPERLNLEIPSKTIIKELYLRRFRELPIYPKDAEYNSPKAIFSISSLNKLSVGHLLEECLKLIKLNPQLKELKYFQFILTRCMIKKLTCLLPSLYSLKLLMIFINYPFDSEKWVYCEFLPSTLQYLYVPFATLKGDIRRFSNLNEVRCNSISEKEGHDWLVKRKNNGKTRFVYGKPINNDRFYLDSFFPNFF